MNFKKWAVVCTSITILALWLAAAPNADPDNRNHTLQQPNAQHITI
ncbi:phosphatase [Bacillus pumilus]|nr:phosphatase [Bacillus pumilus]WHX46202.1 phosphatase [Bacillus pumilus]